MRVSTLDSVVFHTTALPAVRHFYKTILGLQVGTFEKNSNAVADANERYVNYLCGGTLLCFEAGKTTELGAIVLLTRDVLQAKLDLRAAGVNIKQERDQWLRFRDPDGRTILLQERSVVA